MNFINSIDHKKAFKCYKLAAEQVNPVGKINLAYCYIKGLGVEKDIEKALNIYNELILADYSPAYYRIGKYYINQNFNEALSYKF